MSLPALVARLAAPVALSLLTACTATMQAVKEDATRMGESVRQFVAPTPEEQAAKAQRDAIEHAAEAQRAQAAALSARDPNRYIAPSLNPDLAREMHRQIQGNKRFNPEGRPFAFNSLSCENALKSATDPASAAAMNPNNQNSATNQARSRVNGALNGAMQKSTIGQIFQPSLNGVQTAEAVQSKQTFTACSQLAVADKLADSGKKNEAFARVNGILNVAFAAGMIGEPGVKFSSEATRGITADGVQGTIGVIGDKAVDLLPKVGQGGALGEVLNKVPGLRR